jgi:hypothetical protein
MWRFYVARLATRRTVCEPALVSGEETGPSDKREDLPGGGPTSTAFAFLGGGFVCGINLGIYVYRYQKSRL